MMLDILRREARNQAWRAIRRRLRNGHPVTISTPGGVRTLVPYGGNMVRILVPQRGCLSSLRMMDPYSLPDRLL